MCDSLFVYGTLKPIAGQRGGRPAHVWGRIWENGSYSGMRPTGPGDWYLVTGLVSEAIDDGLPEFERREGAAQTRTRDRPRGTKDWPVS